MSLARARSSVLGSPEPPLDPDEVFELLSNERRRGVIHFLKRADDEPLAVDALVDSIAAWEAGDEEVTSSLRASVYSSLVQTHLPRLDDADVLEYVEEEGYVEPTEHTREIQLYLEYSPRSDIPWAEYYLALAAVTAAVVAVAWAGIFPFDAVPPIALGAVITVVFLFSAVAHVVQTRRSRLGSEAFERTRARHR